jgi:phosphoribosylformylglycinamidine (FGAM) synthase-like enzyme
VDLEGLPGAAGLSADKRLFSESTGRFLVTVRPGDEERFGACFQGGLVGTAARIGRVTGDGVLSVRLGKQELIRADIEDLRFAFKRPFGGLI